MQSKSGLLNFRLGGSNNFLFLDSRTTSALTRGEQSREAVNLVCLVTQAHLQIAVYIYTVLNSYRVSYLLVISNFEEREVNL